MNRERTARIFAGATVALAVLSWAAYFSAVALPYRLSQIQGTVFDAALALQILAPLGAAIGFTTARLLRSTGLTLAKVAIAACLAELVFAVLTVHSHSGPIPQDMRERIQAGALQTAPQRDGTSNKTPGPVPSKAAADGRL